MLIKMLADRFDAGGALRTAGSQIDVPNDLAMRWIGDNVAVPVGNSRDVAQGLRKDVPVNQDQLSGSQFVGSTQLIGGGAGSTSVLAVGDSMTHRINSYATPASMVRTNGVAVCTLNGHGLGSGQLVDSNNAVDSTFNVRNAVLTRIDANTFSFPAPGPDGTAVAVAGKVLIVTIQQELSDDAYWVWLNAKLGGSLRLVRNSGVSSNTAADLLARFDADVTAYSSDRIFLQLPVYNDVVNAGYTLAQLTDPVNGLYTQILAKARATGRKVDLIGPPAFNTGNTPALYQIWLGVQKWMRQQARTLPHVTFADVMRYQVNATAATPGNAIAGMLSADGIHESSRGAERKAQAIFDAIGHMIPRVNSLVSSSGDNYGVSTANTNILDVGPWTNSGGTVNAGSNGGSNTGTIGSGLQTECNGGGAASSAVWSMPASPDGIGFIARCVFTPAANNAYALLRLASNIPIARAPGGTRLREAFEVTFYNLNGSNVRTLNVIVNFQGGSNPTQAYALAGRASTQTNWLQGAYGTLVSDTLTASLSPALVAANTTAEQTFTVAGLMPGDVVTVNKPTAQAGLGIVGARVSAADTLAITFANNTAAGITPTAAENYSVSYTRRATKLTIVSNEITVPTDAGITGFDLLFYLVAGGAGTPVVWETAKMSLEKVG